MKNLNNKIKKFFNDRKSIYVIIAVTLFLSLFIEILIGTHFFKTSDYSKTIKYKDLDIYSKKSSFIIKIDDINNFVNDIKVDLNFSNVNKEPKFKLYYYDMKNKKHFVQNNKLGIVYFSSPIVRVGHKSKKIELKFNTNIKDINIKSVKLDGSYDFNIIRFLAIFISIYLVLDLVRYIYLDKKPKLYLYFLKISLLVGCFYAICTPFHYSWDEKEHIVRAYNLSRFNFIQRPEEKVKLPCGLDVFIDNPHAMAIPTTYKGFKNKLSVLSDASKTESKYSYHKSATITYLFPAYSISGLGMLIARLLGLSFVFEFYLGRLFNVIFCSIILSLAVKYSGKYNKIFFMLGLLPLIIFQNASFSADALTNSFALLAVALTLYYKNEKKEFNYKDWFILLVCYIMSFISKIAYFPIGILILMIPTKKFKSKKMSYLIKFITIFICFALFGIGTVYANKMGVVQWTSSAANAKLQMKTIINNPLVFPMAVFNIMSKELLRMFSDLLIFGECGRYDSIVLIIYFIEFVVVVASSKNDNKLFDKLVLLSYVILSIGASMGALYLSFTPVGKNSIDGYQGRYILPILIPFLLLFVSKKFKLEVSENKIIYFILITSVILYIISFFAFYINNYY